MKKTLALALLLAGCSAVGGSTAENYQHVLKVACAAPPTVYGVILTTDQLKQAWLFICTHADSVPLYPVPPEQSLHLAVAPTP